MKPWGILNSKKHMTRVVVYFLIPILQRWLQLHLDMLVAAIQKLDGLGFCLAQKLVPPGPETLNKS
jgi:hypothetical protein